MNFVCTMRWLEIGAWLRKGFLIASDWSLKRPSQRRVEKKMHQNRDCRLLEKDMCRKPKINPYCVVFAVST